MKNPIKIVFLAMGIPLIMLFLQVDHGICLGVTVLSLGACWYAYNKFTEDESNETIDENDETMNDNNMSATNNKDIRVATEYLGMGTKDLCLQLLQKMDIMPVKDDEDENSFYFDYLGERMSFRANNNSKFVILYDTFWKKYPTENLEMVTLARKTVNRANIEYNGFKLLYTFNEGTMWIHSNNCALLIPEIPNLKEYFKHVLDAFIYAHKAFDEAMYELMKEEGEKEK